MKRWRKMAVRLWKSQSQSKSHYWRVARITRWTSEVKGDWQREWMNWLENGWWSRWIAYWTRISMRQQNCQMFALSSWCLRVCFCAGTFVGVCLGSWSVCALEIKYSACSSDWKHLQNKWQWDDIFFLYQPPREYSCFQIKSISLWTSTLLYFWWNFYSYHLHVVWCTVFIYIHMFVYTCEFLIVS